MDPKKSDQYFSKRSRFSCMGGMMSSSASRYRILRYLVLLVFMIATVQLLAVSSPFYKKYMDTRNSPDEAEELATITQQQSNYLEDYTSSENNNKDKPVLEEASEKIPIDISRLMNRIRTRVHEVNKEHKIKLQNSGHDNGKILCDELPPGLGPISANKNPITLEEVEQKFPDVELGGVYTPKNCTARHKVAIIVPYRDRAEHLPIFLNHMHPFLMRQQLEYGIFIVEQDGNLLFNRAKLKNVGVMESQRLKEGGWDCFVFNDIDLLPLDERIMYSCPKQPRHMSAVVDTLKNRLPYTYMFGGAVTLTLEQFTKVNGFSNNYWGWGAEDDDMAVRLKKSNYRIERYNNSIARFTMLDHKKEAANPSRYLVLSQTEKGFENDGLSTLRYTLTQMKKTPLFTHIVANIHDTL